MQLGIRNDENTGEIMEDWKNKNYVVIGKDTTSGADEAYFLLDTGKKDRPVLLFDPYYLGPDAPPAVICNSLKNFVSILNELQKYEKKFDSGLSKKLLNILFGKFLRNDNKYFLLFIFSLIEFLSNNCFIS